MSEVDSRSSWEAAAQRVKPPYTKSTEDSRVS